MLVSSSNILRSSGVAPGFGSPSGHVACGKLKSPAIMMLGVGEASDEYSSLNFASKGISWAAVDLCPPRSSGGLYMLHSIKFKASTLMHKASTPSEEYLSKTSDPAAKSLRRYTPSPPLFRPLLFFCRDRSARSRV